MIGSLFEGEVVIGAYQGIDLETVPVGLDCMRFQLQEPNLHALGRMSTCWCGAADEGSIRIFGSCFGGGS
jgi:hypothetical protein